MNAQVHPPNRLQLLAKISSLDIAINKLVKWNDALDFKSGSIMISGHNQLRKEFHEILVFDSTLPIPVDRLKIFINDYVQDLVHQRFNLVNKLEQPESLRIIRDHILDKAEFFCPVCVKATDHKLHSQDSIVYWQCVECSNVNNNCEID